MTIDEKVEQMTTEQRRSYYYIACQAMKESAGGINRQTIIDEFGSETMLTIYQVMSACYPSLSPIEQDGDYNRAKQDLSAVAHACAPASLPSASPLAAYRTRAGMTQAQLAEKSGVNVRQIRRIESGEAKPFNVTTGNLVAIADALGINVKDLL